jgi:hypothetical protein
LSARANQLLGWLGLQYFTACTTLSYEMGCALGLQYFTATPRFSPIPKAAQLQPIFIIAAKSIGKGPKYHNNYLHISSKIANKPIDIVIVSSSSPNVHPRLIASGQKTQIKRRAVPYIPWNTFA